MTQTDWRLLVPAEFSFRETQSRQRGWGRWVSLSPKAGVLASHFQLTHGDWLLVDFELGGERFTEVPAEVAHVEVDHDGYWVADVRFRRDCCRMSLGAVLRRVAPGAPSRV